MPFSLKCKCGRTLRAPDKLAGRRVRCPGCRELLTVPKPAPQEDIEDEAAKILLDGSPDEDEEPFEQAIRTEPLPRQVTAPPTESPEPQPIPRRPPPIPRPTPPPRSERAERRRGPRVAFEEGWFGSINAGIIGGILMIIIAVVWFFGGLLLGRIFFYPPILLILGLVAIVKGLMNRD